MHNGRDFAAPFRHAGWLSSSIILLCFTICCKKEKSFERGTTVPQAVTGKAIFSINNPCREGASVQIVVTGTNGQLIKVITPVISSEDPNCDDPGYPKIELPVGRINLTAVCDGDSSKSQVEISADTCQTFRWNYDGTDPTALEGDWFPLRQRWTYSDLTGGDTLAITSSETERFGGSFDYTIFRNDATLEQRAYRKSKSKYYERVTYFRDSPLSQPAELLFLQDDLPAGESWETGASRPLIRGFAFNAKIKNTIVRKGHKQSFNGKTYFNLIEVKTEILLKSDADADYQQFGKASTTVYAKGIGVVFYEDDIFKKSRAILNYSVIP